MKCKIGVLASMLILCTIGINATGLDSFPYSMAEGDKLEAKVVVGANASSHDYLSAMHLLFNLQDEVDSLGDCDTGSLDRLNGSFQITTNDNMLESVEPINFTPPLTAQEFTPLESGVLRNTEGSFTYDQYLRIMGSGRVSFTKKDSETTNESAVPDSYLMFEEDIPVYEYRLVFPTPLASQIEEQEDTSHLTGLEEEEIELLGEEFTITKATTPSNKSIRLHLLEETNQHYVEPRESIRFTHAGTEHNLTVVNIVGGDEVVLKVDGEFIDELKEGESHALDDGALLQVNEVLGGDSSDSLAGISFGEREIILKDPDYTDGEYSETPYTSGDEKIENTDVNIKAQNNNGQLAIEYLRVRWTPEETHYVPSQQGLLDVLEDPESLFSSNFDIHYAGREQDLDVEMLDIVPMSDDTYALQFENKLGEELQVPLFHGNLKRFGTEDNILRMHEVPITTDDYFIVTSDGSKTPPYAEGYTHLLRYRGQDSSDNTLSIENVGSEETMDVNYPEGGGMTSIRLNDVNYDINVLPDGSIMVDQDNSGSINKSDQPVLVTRYGMNIKLNTLYNGTNNEGYKYRQLVLFSKKKESDIAADQLNGALYNQIGPAVQQSINATLSAMGSTYSIDENPVETPEAITQYHDAVRVTVEQEEGELDIAALERCLDGANKKQVLEAVTDEHDAALQPYGIYLDNIIYHTFMEQVCYPTFTEDETFMYDMGETDNQQGVTSYSQMVRHTAREDNPDQLTVLGPAEQIEHFVYVQKDQAQQINITQNQCDELESDVQETVTDQQLSGVKSDLLLIGGPCANQVTAEVLGNQNDCTHGFAPDIGRLTYAEHKGQDVVIVAGHSAQDTRRAAQALGHFSQHELQGKDLAVKGSAERPDFAPYQPDKYEEQKEKSQKAQQEQDQPDTSEDLPEDEPSKEQQELDCEGSTSEEGSFDLEISRFGVTKELTSHPAVEAGEDTATISFEAEETFEAQYGVEWLEYTVHLLKGGCSGEEITSREFRWTDGDKDKSQTVQLPEESCYCLHIAPEDIKIDSADIQMVPEETITIPFASG